MVNSSSVQLATWTVTVSGQVCKRDWVSVTSIILDALCGLLRYGLTDCGESDSSDQSRFDCWCSKYHSGGVCWLGRGHYYNKCDWLQLWWARLSWALFMLLCFKQDWSVSLISSSTPPAICRHWWVWVLTNMAVCGALRINATMVWFSYTLTTRRDLKSFIYASSNITKC